MTIDSVIPARVRTFHPRRGRMSGRQHDAVDRLWPRLGLTIPVRPTEPASDPAVPLDPVAIFGRVAPLVLEIGSGMGEATASMAAADPARDYLAVEVHTPGIGNLLWLVEQLGLRNVRVAEGDALTLVEHLIAPSSLAAIHIFFPDPWPKTRHHKRRLIQPGHVELLRSRLAPGGTLHCATDWAPYADEMLRALDADAGLVNTFDRFAPRPAYRPWTKFERRGIAAGREIFDLVFRKSVG